MKRRLITVLLALTLVITAAPATIFAAANPTLDNKDVCYTPQNDYKSGDCILTASKVMIRRASILRGSREWSQITNKTLRTPATVLGLLLHNFTFEADGLKYKIGMGVFSGSDDATRIRQFESLIRQHPEGVVVWGSNSSRFGMHGVLLTDVRDGVPYVMDSAYNVGSYRQGILKWTDSSMKEPSKCTQYWYIKEVGLAKNANAPAAGRPLAAASATNVNTESTLSINQESVPSEIKQGSGFSVTGYINSNYRITRVEVSILNQAGTAVISKTVNPNDWCYDLDDLDRSIKFGTLAAGYYRYRVSASDEKRSVTFVDSTFRVLGRNEVANPTLSVSNASQPTSVDKGKGFTVKGTVSSNTTITNVTVSIIDDSGRVYVSASANPGSKSYNLKKIDARVKFGGLAAGSYRYVITATAGSLTQTLIDKPFNVVNNSKLKISSYNYPRSVKKGRPFTIRGKVTSDKKITKVTVQIVDEAGNEKISCTRSPGSKSYNLKKIDPKIRFGKLPRGTFYYRVIATDQAKTLTLVEKKFVIK